MLFKPYKPHRPFKPASAMRTKHALQAIIVSHTTGDYRRDQIYLLRARVLRGVTIPRAQLTALSRDEADYVFGRRPDNPHKPKQEQGDEQ